MPHPQDVAVPSLPEPLTWRWTNSETGGHGFHPIKGHGNPRFAHIYTWDAVFAADQMNTRWLEGYKAGRAAGRASAEPELPDGWVPCLITYEGDEPEEVAFGPKPMMDRLTKWLIRYFAQVYAERYPASPTPTASIAPKAEGEAVDTVAARRYPDRVEHSLSHLGERLAAPVAQAAAGASDDVLAKLRWVDHVLGEVRQQVAAIESLSYGRACDKLKEVIAALSPRPEADADRASGGGVDTERLDWLLANPNTVLEDAGNEWFILDADSEPTYFKSGREAIDAARATPTTKD